MKELKNPQDIKNILNSKEPVAIFFYMSSCPHCKVMHAPWAKLEKEKGGVKFVKAESENIPSELGVGGFPEFRYVEGGQVKKTVSGEMDGAALKASLFGGGRRHSLRHTRRVRNPLYRSSRRSIRLRSNLSASRRRRR